MVSLCDTHHSKLHKVAYAIMGRRSFASVLLGEDDERKKKICWLASLVVKAEALTKDDPNRHTRVMLSLNKERQAQIAFVRSKLKLNSNIVVFVQAFDVLIAVLKKDK